jgi:hypothetical protein
LRKITVVTTSHERGYADYGREMLRSFDAHWPDDVRLWFYHEGFGVEPPSARVELFDLRTASPGLARFKERHQDHPRARGMMRKRWKLRWGGLKLALERPWGVRRYRYRWDAVRFAHKMYAIFHAAANCNSDVLIWIDADTRFFAPVDRATIESFVPADAFLGCLRRTMMHTECGFVAYNLRHPAIAGFLRDFAAFYDQDLFLREQEFHDSWLFDIARRRAEARGHRSHDIAEGIGKHAEHVLINSRLGAFMDHMKGDRKSAGQSHADDLIVERAEAYWQTAGRKGTPGTEEGGAGR